MEICPLLAAFRSFLSTFNFQLYADVRNLLFNNTYVHVNVKGKQCHGKASDTGESNWSSGGKFSLTFMLLVLIYVSLGISYNSWQRVKAGHTEVFI